MQSGIRLHPSSLALLTCESHQQKDKAAKSRLHCPTASDNMAILLTYKMTNSVPAHMTVNCDDTSGASNPAPPARNSVFICLTFTRVMRPGRNYCVINLERTQMNTWQVYGDFEIMTVGGCIGAGVPPSHNWKLHWSINISQSPICTRLHGLYSPTIEVPWSTWACYRKCWKEHLESPSRTRQHPCVEEKQRGTSNLARLNIQ